MEQLVGQREYELAWLNKGNECTGMERLYQMIDEKEPRISVRRQCSLLELRRTPLYYAKRRSAELRSGYFNVNGTLGYRINF